MEVELASPRVTQPTASSSSSSLSRVNRTGGMTIDVRLATTGQTLRPLPKVPFTPRSAPPFSLPIPPAPLSAPPIPPKDYARSPSPRPLPSPPDAFPSGPHAALPLPSPMYESKIRPNAPYLRRGPPRSASLKVQTSPEALKTRAFEAQSPATPVMPELPSPQTLQRKRFNKLRRHLGESVQVVLNRPDNLKNVDVLSRLREHSESEDCPVIDITLESVLAPRSATDSDSSSLSESDDVVSGDYFMSAPKPSSRKVMRERGKARWTEDDFSKVLQDLRSL
ncbi:hypothetical protein R3P38DRAFT_3171878 [Favolaschia claudopus]|uniref:Uncharacterized protein n=1 Tax=Favolaschia claudopus TaxID=2862362 RepID=A0AAW0DTY4_9AGAR